MKKVFGVGINDYDGRVFIDNKKIKSYQIWQGILGRCYDKKHQRRQPTYMDATVCDEWLLFSNFKKWFDENYPDELARELGIKFDLDKDLLSDKAKIYSPDTCVFLPYNVNRFLSNRYSSNTSGYIGVCWHKRDNRWDARINDFNTNQQKHLGYFTNIEDAKDAYNKAREIEALKVKEYLRELGYNEKIINKIK